MPKGFCHKERSSEVGAESAVARLERTDLSFLKETLTWKPPSHNMPLQYVG